MSERFYIYLGERPPARWRKWAKVAAFVTLPLWIVPAAAFLFYWMLWESFSDLYESFFEED